MLPKIRTKKPNFVGNLDSLKKQFVSIFFFIFCFFCNYSTFAQLANFSAIGTTGTTSVLSPNITNPNIKVSALTRSNGILAASATDRLASTDFTNLTTISETSYYSFSIAIPAGQRLTISNLVLVSDRNTNGIRTCAIRSSIDNFATNLNTTAINFAATTSQTNTITTPTLTNLTSGFIEFRLYGFGAINCSGNWRIQSLSINGSTNALPDILPPTLTHFTIINPTQIQLRFSEVLNKTQAQNLTNYTINNGIGNPQNAILQNPDSTTVLLNFANPLIFTQSYSLIINNLADISNNTNPTITQNFTHTDTRQPALIRCVPITNDALDLYFSEEVNIASSQNAANYTVCNEPNVVAAVRDTDKNLVHLLFAAPISENANRVIVARNIVDNQANTVLYSATNFMVDTRKPTVDSLLTVSPTQITLIFSEPVDRISAELLNNYTHNEFGFPTSARLDNQDFTRVYLTFSSAMVQGKNYTLRVTKVTDANGNIMTTRTIPFVYDKIPPISPNLSIVNLRLIELYFSEFMDKTTVENLANYELKLNGTTTVPCVSVWICDKNFTTVFLRPTSQLLDNQNYTLTLKNIRDRQQNIIVPTTINFNTIKPTLNKIHVIDNKSIKLYFSEIITQTSAENLANYTITNNTIAQVRRNSTDFSVIDLIFTNNFAIGSTNTLLINNLQDINANIINPNTSAILGLQNFIQNVSVISPRLIDVKFSKVVPLPSLLDTTNYLINNNIGKPIGITRNTDDSTMVRLLLRNMINPNSNYLLTVSGFGLDCNEFLTASTATFIDDRSLPTVLSVSAISANEVLVLFSKNVDITTAEALNHYQITGFSITDASLGTDLRTVTLKLNSNLQQNITYTLGVSRVKDRQGNTMLSQSLAFQRPLQPKQNELIISELMPDPDPVKNLPNVEYIELYNNSRTAFQLIGLKLQDATTTTTLKDYVLQPDNFVLITATGNKNLFAMSLQDKIMEVSSMLSLTNAGEEIKVLDQDNKLIFNVLYSDSWYRNEIKKNGGWALEMINPTSICLNKSANYIASQDSTGGTPSFKNSIWKTQIDTVKPKITNVFVKTLQQIEIIFSEDVDSLAMLNSSNYLISNGLGIRNLQYLSATKVLLNTNTNLDSATLYTISAKNIKDCAENQANTSFQFAIGTRAKENDLLITEIMADETPRVGLPLAEYIEIYNASNRIINLGSIQLSDENGSIILPQKIIKSGEYLTLSGTTKADSLGALGITNFPSLANIGEKLTLSDTATYNRLQPIIIHSVTYSDSWYGNETKKLGGWSLEMIDTNFPCGEAINWTASTHFRGGTPNLKNSVSRTNKDTEAPKIAGFRVLDNKNIEVSFNEKMNENSIKNLANFVTNPIISIQNIALKSDRQIQITLQNPINTSITYKLSISNTADCSGNILNTSLDFGLGRSPQKGELVITEIFADESPAVKLPLCEWIEIYNNSTDLLSLNGLQLADDNTKINLPNFVIPAKNYVILCNTTRVDSLAKVVNRDKIVGVSSLPSLANAGEKLEILNGSSSIVQVIYSDTWYKDDVKKQGGWSLEMIDVNNICGESENWAASIDARGGTPTQENSIKAENIDKIAPNLTGIKWLSNTELEVNFSEKMDSLTITNKANFGIIPTIEIKEIIFIDNKTTKIITANLLNTNILYELQAQKIKDCSGNETVFSSVLFGKGTSPQSNELLITELMADASPTVQLPDREYIEIFNNSTKLIDLGTVRLQDETNTINLPNTVLKPQEYAILCSTSSTEIFKNALNGTFPNSRIIGVIDFPSLNNTGEKLSLLNGQKSVIHTVDFLDTWYRDEVKKLGGWSLEMIDTNFPCLEASNWRASTHTSGGTPARENSVKTSNPDTIFPSIESLNTLNNSTLQIIFNEKLDSASVADLQNYSIIPNIEIEKVTLKDNKIVILQTKRLSVSIVYELQVKNIKDCTGNPMKLQNFTFGLGESPQQNDIIITELLPDPSPTVNLPESEYIELYNPTNKIINLQGATLTNGTSIAKFSNLIILPKTYVLLCPTSSVENFKKYAPNSVVFGLSPWISLANDGDTLTIRNARNNLVFDILYNISWFRDSEKADGGWALEMIDINFPCVQTANWIASENKNGGTPATTNSVAKPNPDTQAPILQRVEVVDNKTLRLVFNEKLDSLSSLAASYKITDSKNNSNIINFVQQVQFSTNANTSIILNLQNIIAPKTVYNLAVFGVADCSKNSIATTQNKIFVLPELGEKGDLLLNEVLFNPPVGGVDFVEIYNQSDKFIDLKDWGLTRVYNGQIENKKIVSTQTLIIAPKSYMVFTPNLLQLKTQYPQGADSVWIETAIPTYSDESGSIILMRFDNLIIDRFDYDKDYHFKLLDDKSGVSLERIDFEVATNDKNNWFSAAAPKFGTAGYKNSQAKGNILQQNKCWWVENEVITPDSDGWQDFAFIRYACNQTGFVANGTVYDSEGRKIKTLLQSQILGTEGFFRWDGDRDSGEKARIGYYLIHIQTFNLKGEREDWQLKCVVGSKE